MSGSLLPSAVEEVYVKQLINKCKAWWGVVGDTDRWGLSHQITVVCYFKITVFQGLNIMCTQRRNNSLEGSETDPLLLINLLYLLSRGRSFREMVYRWFHFTPVYW